MRNECFFGTGLVLTLVSYQPGGAVTPMVASGILAITAALPIACHVISYYFLKQYDLDEAAVRKIHFELAGMYAQAEQAK